jgi:arylsulfatase A-like enzyme
MGAHKPWTQDFDYNPDDYSSELEKFTGMFGLIDRFLKQIYEELENQQMLEDTIFIVTGDHGESPFVNKRTEKGDWEILLVPFLFKVPDRFLTPVQKENLIKNSDAPAITLDIFHTVSDILGFSFKENYDKPNVISGKSLLNPIPPDRIRIGYDGLPFKPLKRGFK